MNNLSKMILRKIKWWEKLICKHNYWRTYGPFSMDANPGDVQGEVFGGGYTVHCSKCQKTK